LPIAGAYLDLLFPTQAGRDHPRRAEIAGRNWPAGGVVTICGTRGRLACAVIATSGFVAGRLAEPIVGESDVRADDEEIQGKF